MPGGTLSNPKGAFGYQNVDSTGSNPLGQGQNYTPIINTYRNASTVDRIFIGQPVVRTTGSTRGDLIRRGSTADANSLMFVGIALTTAGLNTTATTATTVGVGDHGTDWLQVMEQGVFAGALLSSAVVAGDPLTVNASTGTTASGTTGAGSLGAAPTTQGTAGYIGVAGVALSSGTTGTTGFLTTVGPRGYVLVQKSIVPLTSV